MGLGFFVREHRLVRFLFGSVFSIAGASLLLLSVGILPHQGAFPIIVPIMGVTFTTLGLMLAIGVFTGVRGDGSRPETMSHSTRLLLDGLGTVGALGFASMFTVFALSDMGGKDALLFRLFFGGFSLLLWAAIIAAAMAHFTKPKAPAGSPRVENEIEFGRLPWAARVVLAAMGLLALAIFATAISIIALGQTETPVRLSIPIPLRAAAGLSQIAGQLIFGVFALVLWFLFTVLSRAAWRMLKPGKAR